MLSILAWLSLACLTQAAPSTVLLPPAPFVSSAASGGGLTDRSFLFNNPTLDLLAISSLSKKSAPTPKPPASSALNFLVLSQVLGGNGFGGNGFGGNGFNRLFGNPYYDQYGVPQDPAKKAILLSGIASGAVSPLTAVAMDRNPGMTTADSLVVSALGNNALTNLLVLNQAPGQGLVNNGGVFGNGFGQGVFGNGFGQGIFGSNNGVLPALAVASAVGGSGGLGTLLALDALGGVNNNGGYYNNGGGYYNGGSYNGGYYSGGLFNGGFGNVLGNVGNSLNNIFG
jgi:hypothetical protein